jgi:signal transduction histidine kinase
VTQIERLGFPDAPRTDLERTIEELMASAQRVLATQGRLRHLLEANRAVVEELDLEQVLRRIAEAAVSLVDAQFGALGVIAADGRLEQFIHVGIPDDEALIIGHLPEGHGLLGAVVDAAEPIRLEHLAADERSSGFPPHHPAMDAFLGVPIRVRGEIYGNLYLTNRAHGSFTQEDEDLVTALAATAGIAIDNARLFAAQASLATELAQVRGESQRWELAEERSRIARDLHDHVIQRLFATGLSLQSLAGTASGEFGDALTQQVDAIDAAIAEIRTAVFALDSRKATGEPGLRHRVLDVVGELTATLSSAPRLTFSGPVDLLIDGSLASDVVAVVREGLSNVARHASASQSSVDVRVTDDLVSVRIEDDGSGVTAAPGTSSGTKNLAARAREHGGSFSVSARSPRGTSMVWTARLPDAA